MWKVWKTKDKKLETTFNTFKINTDQTNAADSVKFQLYYIKETHEKHKQIANKLSIKSMSVLWDRINLSEQVLTSSTLGGKYWTLKITFTDDGLVLDELLLSSFWNVPSKPAVTSSN